VSKKRLRYPAEIDGDLRDSGLTEKERGEVLATAWEYVRCGIPEFTNWERYITFVRLTALTTVAEYRGDLIQFEEILKRDGRVLGYPVRAMLESLFVGTSVAEAMILEYASSLVFMAEKTRRQRSDLCRRYIEALASSPATYFRMRDCDAQVRLFIAAAAACNDLDPQFREGEYRAMAEIGMTMYDAVAFYKHRAEGEVCNVYAYCGPDLQLRRAAYEAARSSLWELETRWYRSVEGRCAINLLKNLPLIHIAMSRYRFVEDGLTIGRPETSEVVQAARANVKLWYRSDAVKGDATRTTKPLTAQRTVDSVRHMLLPDLVTALETADREACPRCTRRATYGALAEGQFGGVVLCEECRAAWREYVLASGPRHAHALHR
jgi:hypothetical protein